MSGQDNAQLAPSSLSGAIFVIFGWMIFGMVVTFNSVAAAAGAEVDSPVAAVIGYAPYVLCAAILIVSIVSMQTAARFWGMFGGWLHLACGAVSGVSAMAVVTLGLLRLHGYI